MAETRAFDFQPSIYEALERGNQVSAYDDAFAAATKVGGGNFSASSGGSPYDSIMAGLKPAAASPLPPASEPVQDFSGTLRIGPLDTGVSLPPSVNRRLAQFGSGVADWGLAARQIFGSATKGDATEKSKIDAQLNDGLGGKALSVAGQIAPSLAIPFGYAGALGRAAPVVEGAIAGATQGAFQPVKEGDSRAFNMGVGGISGAALPAVVQGARALATPRDTDLANRAINQYGIPLGVADVTDSRFVKGARSVLNDLPLTGAMGAADRDGVQRGFNRAVGRTFGANADNLSPQVMGQARQNIGGELNRIWNNNNLRIDPQFITDLQTQMGRMQNLNPQQAQAVNAQVQNLLQRVNQNGEIPGSFVNNWQSELRLAADGEKGLHQDILNSLRRSVINTFNRSVTGPDAQALTTARGQYKAFKTVEPLMNKAEAAVAGRVSGDVPAALLPNAVAQSYGSQVAQSPFADLSQIAGRYLVDRTPQTGGSVRALMQNAGVGTLALGGGLGGAAAAGSLPAAVAGAGGAIGLQGLLGSTRVANSLVTQPVQRGLMAAPQLTPALRELLTTSLQRSPIPLGLGLLTAPALE
jgi:hypothetical protein